nr:LuxR C-terminal-related transcriptional regulator [Hyphomonas sp. Mor2]
MTMPDVARAEANVPTGLRASEDASHSRIDFTDVATRIGESSTGEEVWAIISEVCRQTETQGACCRCFPSNASAEQTVFFSTTDDFSPALAGALQNSPGYLDAFLHASVKSLRPFRWSEINHVLDPKSPQMESYRRDVASQGDGLVVPVFGPLFRHGYFCFHAKDGRTFEDAEILMMHSLSQTAYLKLLDVMYREEEGGRALSSRELEIINLIARGQSNQTVAEGLDVSINTINTYMKRIFEKLDVSDRVSAVMRAYALGYIA